jgi:hypothetical protein
MNRMTMTVILAAIDAEIARLQQVRDAVSALETPTSMRRGPGRPPKAASTPKPKKRVMSAAARARIAAAQKKRWAAQRKAK